MDRSAKQHPQNKFAVFAPQYVFLRIHRQRQCKIVAHGIHTVKIEPFRQQQK